MRGRRQVAGALVAGLVAGVLVLAVPAPVAADGGTDVEVTCSGIPLLGTTTTTATVNADDDVDPVEVGGTVINTLNVPVPVGDVPVEVTVTELKLTNGVTIAQVTASGTTAPASRRSTLRCPGSSSASTASPRPTAATTFPTSHRPMVGRSPAAAAPTPTPTTRPTTCPPSPQAPRRTRSDAVQNPPPKKKGCAGPGAVIIIGALLTVVGGIAGIGLFIYGIGQTVTSFDDIEGEIPTGSVGTLELEEGGYYLYMQGEDLVTNSGSSSDFGGDDTGLEPIFGLVEPDVTITGPDGSDVSVGSTGIEVLTSFSVHRVGFASFQADRTGTYTFSVSEGDPQVDAVAVGPEIDLFGALGGLTIGLVVGFVVGGLGVVMFIAGIIWLIVRSTRKPKTPPPGQWGGGQPQSTGQTPGTAPGQWNQPGQQPGQAPGQWGGQQPQQWGQPPQAPGQPGQWG